MSLFVDLFTALIVALGLEFPREQEQIRPSRPDTGGRSRRLTGRLGSMWAFGALMLICGALSVLAWIPRSPYPSAPIGVPAYFTSGAVRHTPYGAVTFILPYPSVAEVEPMLWQAAAHMRFRIVRGYGFFSSGDGTASDFPAVLGPTPVRRFLWSEVTRGPPIPSEPSPGMALSS